jgi:DNA-binding NarL/FixJ family response regulator
VSHSVVGVMLYNDTVAELNRWRNRALLAERELADLRRSRARQLRVLALRREGWKLSAIAFELHMSKGYASQICCRNGLQQRHPTRRTKQ